MRSTDAAITRRLVGLDLDTESMWAVSDIQRAATAIRNHFEQTVLRDTGLTWTGFVVMRVVWISDGIESADAAREAGISKGTLTGVVKTLESYRHIVRTKHESDGRRVLLGLSPSGQRLMEDLLPAVNREEAFVVSALTTRQRTELADSLRIVIERLESPES